MGETRVRRRDAALLNHRELLASMPQCLAMYGLLQRPNRFLTGAVRFKGAVRFACGPLPGSVHSRRADMAGVESRRVPE